MTLADAAASVGILIGVAIIGYVVMCLIFVAGTFSKFRKDK